MPTYLEAISADLMASASPPIRYRAGDEPVVYSVGKDGIDDGGVDVVYEPLNLQEFGIGRPSRESGDITFRLTPRAKKPPSEDDDGASMDGCPGD